MEESCEGIQFKHISQCNFLNINLLYRFSDIIIAEFNGHTHNDEFKVYYNEEGTEAFATAWNGGSITTYSNVNPNYRVYDVDDETYVCIV
jgi:sphingomyelin phosphodiesterase